ncbi:MAG: 4Fe-4S dicluster domain-containing protein [Dehalococcoidia bacterium]|nr:4Fe-4S dicluster domain-containing protein [Dehalococcoidia bacterium]
MTVTELPTDIIPHSSFRAEVEEKSGQKISACFQCEKCTNGCPVTFAMDIAPHRLIRSVHLGLKEEVLKSDTIWVCASCEACTTRCPNGIDIAHIMDTLRQMSQRQGFPASRKNVPLLHRAFLTSVKRRGRVNETGLAVSYTLKSAGLGGLLKQGMNQGLGMLRRGKLRLLPDRVRAGDQISDIFKNTEKKG